MDVDTSSTCRGRSRSASLYRRSLVWALPVSPLARFPQRLAPTVSSAGRVARTSLGGQQLDQACGWRLHDPFVTFPACDGVCSDSEPLTKLALGSPQALTD